jgi:hypothetical protein
MSRAFVGGVLGLVICLAGVQAEAEKEGKELTGTVKAVNASKNTITVTVDGKDRVVQISKNTKFVGPKGGNSKEGIKDDRLVKGAEVTIVLSGNNKTAREIKLPRRKNSDK